MSNTPVYVQGPGFCSRRISLLLTQIHAASAGYDLLPSSAYHLVMYAREAYPTYKEDKSQCRSIVEKLSALAAELENGTLSVDWFHGFKYLQRRADGYVTWKNCIVEHYSYPNSEKEAERVAAQRLVEKCRKLNTEGWEATGHRLHYFSIYSSLPVFTFSYGKCARSFILEPENADWVEALDKLYAVLVHPERQPVLLAYHRNGNAGVGVTVVNGEPLVCASPAGEFSSPADILRQLYTEGFSALDLSAKELECSSSFFAFLASAGLSLQMLSRAISDAIPTVAPFQFEPLTMPDPNHTGDISF